MGRALALCLLPALLACLSLALAFEAFGAGLGMACVVVLCAAGAVLAAGCARMVGASLFRSFRSELVRRGQGHVGPDAQEVSKRRRAAWVLLGVGCGLLVLGLALGGEPLFRLLRFLLSL